MTIRLLTCIGCLMLAVTSAVAQTTFTPRRFIRAVGEGKVSGKPDQVQIDFAVVTQASTAQEAAAQNATLSTAVLNALKQLLGATADLKTLNYSLSPVYNYPRDNSAPTLSGFIASNTVEATSSNLDLPGRIIDTAIQAGANRVDSLRFTIKDEQPVRGQALRLAAQQARTHADAIATGLGVRLGAVANAAETYSTAIPYADVRGATGTGASAPATPVQPGTVDITATVTLEIEIAQ